MKDNCVQPADMQKILSVILLAMLCTPACSESFGPFDIPESRPVSEIWVNPGFYSYHFNKDQELNNSNPGLGVEYRYSTVSSLTVGGFFNSDRHTSHYAGWYWQPLAIGTVRFGAVMGGFDGYPRMNNGNWFFSIIPVASIEGERIGMNFIFIPTYKDQVYGALSFQLKIRLD
jgi:hypothetical protein